MPTMPAFSGMATLDDAALRRNSLSHRGLSRAALSDASGMSFSKATGFSVLLHVLGPPMLAILAFLLLLLLSWLLHFNWMDWFQRKSPPADLEFTLVSDTHAERPVKPLFKGSFNQKAGGRKNPQAPVKPAEPEAPRRTAKNAVEPPRQPAHPSAAQSQTNPAPSPAILPSRPEGNTSPPSVAAPTHPSTEKPASEPDSATAGNTESGSITGNGIAGNGSNANPQGGDSAQPGVDVAQDIDFGPFMADLERRIKRNWVPPRGSESRKVKLMFYLHRDGRLFKVETLDSSGDPLAERAAIAAVESSAPFMALPPQIKEDVLPIEFTFDYNVLNLKNTKRKNVRQ